MPILTGKYIGPTIRQPDGYGTGAGLASFDFSLSDITFLAGMAKRAGGTFAAAPIVQG